MTSKLGASATVLYTLDERVPRRVTEHENGTFARVLRVPHTNPPAAEPGDLNAVAVESTPRTLSPFSLGQLGDPWPRWAARIEPRRSCIDPADVLLRHEYHDLVIRRGSWLPPPTRVSRPTGIATVIAPLETRHRLLSHVAGRASRMGRRCRSESAAPRA